MGPWRSTWGQLQAARSDGTAVHQRGLGNLGQGSLGTASIGRRPIGRGVVQKLLSVGQLAEALPCVVRLPHLLVSLAIRSGPVGLSSFL